MDLYSTIYGTMDLYSTMIYGSMDLLNAIAIAIDMLDKKPDCTLAAHGTFCTLDLKRAEILLQKASGF